MKGRAAIVRLALVICGGLALVVLSVNHKLVHYVSVQGTGQIKILLGARPVSEYLDDENFPEGKKEKLRLIAELKDFAVSELGLKDNGSYNKMYDQGDSPLVWLVIAAPEFSLDAFKWKFPIVGEFSYKGYFKKADAEKEAAKMEKNGYETRVRPASAWSTLGYFKDPILSSMLDNSEGDLAELIFHEMTHGTVFVKNDLQFNENLASFIGEKGAIYYLSEKYGEDSPQLKEYVDDLYDYGLLYDHIIAGARKLDGLYKSFTDEMSLEEKRRLKDEMITGIIAGIHDLPVRKEGRYSKYKDFKPNNAYFSSYMTYRNDLSSFEQDFEAQGGDLPKYIEWIKIQYKDRNVKK